jgi:hypothetical protein
MAQTGPSPLKYLSFGTWNQLVPKEGPKALPIPLDFTVQQSYEIDFGIIAQAAQLEHIQCIYIDNKDNSQPVTIVTDIIGQTLVCPPQRQGFFPIVIASNSPKIIVTSIGGTNCTLIVMNVPMPSGTWASTKEQASYDPLGRLIVSDPILDATVFSNYVQNLMHGWTSQDKIVPKFFSTSTGSLATVTAAGNTTIIAASATENFAICGFSVWVTGDATFAGAPGNVTLELRRGANAFWRGAVTLPMAAGTPGVMLANETNLNMIGTALNEAIVANLSAALSTGQILVTVRAAAVTYTV